MMKNGVHEEIFLPKVRGKKWGAVTKACQTFGTNKIDLVSAPNYKTCWAQDYHKTNGFN